MADNKSQQSKSTSESSTSIKNDPVVEAYKQAEADIEADPDIKTHSEPGDDLDEGELAKLEGTE
jgi:cell fate (sporulation/competence/biofilm development) regulator YmcA (YheA/YmcA/DUF963 family)